MDKSGQEWPAAGVQRGSLCYPFRGAEKSLLFEAPESPECRWPCTRGGDNTSHGWAISTVQYPSPLPSFSRAPIPRFINCPTGSCSRSKIIRRTDRRRSCSPTFVSLSLFPPSLPSAIGHLPSPLFFLLVLLFAAAASPERPFASPSSTCDSQLLR